MSVPGGIPWSEDEDRILRDNPGATAEALEALLPGRSRKSIYQRRNRLRQPKSRFEARRKEPPDPDFVVEVMAFIRRWELSKSQFGAMAVNSPSFVFALLQGRRSEAGTIERVRAFMAKGNPRPLNSRGAWIAARYRAGMRRVMADEAEGKSFRESDPVERAKTFIRRKVGSACFNAEITRPEHFGRFYIGARLVTRAELLEFARAKGWDG